VETKGVGGLRSILRGGWRRYEEDELWNLDECEEQRACEGVWIVENADG